MGQKPIHIVALSQIANPIRHPVVRSFAHQASVIKLTLLRSNFTHPDKRSIRTFVNESMQKLYAIFLILLLAYERNMPKHDIMVYSTGKLFAYNSAVASSSVELDDIYWVPYYLKFIHRPIIYDAFSDATGNCHHLAHALKTGESREELGRAPVLEIMMHVPANGDAPHRPANR